MSKRKVVPKMLLLRQLLPVGAFLALSAAAFSGVAAESAIAALAAEDELTWLNERTGTHALEWVREQNANTLVRLKSDPRYERYRKAALQTFKAGSLGIAATFEVHEGWIYDSAPDATHPPGTLRRARFDALSRPPLKWETVADFSELARTQGLQLASSHAFGGAGRVMLQFGTAKGWGYGVWREFDLERRTFVTDGFSIPEGRYTSVIWKDDDTLWVAAGGTAAKDFPQTIREWSRGQPFAQSRELFSTPEGEGVVVSSIQNERGKTSAIFAELFNRGQETAYWLASASGKPTRINIPLKTILAGIHKDQLIFKIGREWQLAGHAWPSGAFLSMPVAQMTSPTPEVELIAAPSGPRESFGTLQVTSDALLVSGMENIRGRLWRVTRQGGEWQRQVVPLPDYGSITISLADATSPIALIEHQGFSSPPALYALDTASRRLSLFRAAPAQFNGKRFVTEQFEATSIDGTRILYFVVRPKRSKLDGKTPAIVMGYGSAGSPLIPTYDAIVGRLWLEQGGAWIMANVRGGGEFGDSWHVTRVQRQHAYDDFIAVTEDLIRRRVSSPVRLGLFGYSDGGLLGGVTLNRRPDLFRAAFFLAPHADLLRHDQVAASLDACRAEYGSLDVPEERAFLVRTSPYQNLRAQRQFPSVFVYSNTSDMNVFPGQPRRYAAKMQQLALPAIYFEASEGGHNLGSGFEEIARGYALVYVFYAQELLDEKATVHQEALGVVQ